MTGDALYCQRNICQQVLEADGDYLVTVKENQPGLFAAIELLFDELPPGERLGYAEQVGKHGDRHEVRRVWTSASLNVYLDWPGCAQVGKAERVVERRGRVLRQVRYFITSLKRESPAQLLALRRGHWAIENQVHYVRDVSMGEDGSRVRTGGAPQVMAALRNIVLNLLRHAGWTNIAEALRHYAWQPAAAFSLLGIPL